MRPRTAARAPPRGNGALHVHGLDDRQRAEHKEQQKRIRKAQKSVEECERKIATMETRLKELDALLMQPENAADMELVTEYTTTHQALEQANEQWMELSEQLESLKNE